MTKALAFGQNYSPAGGHRPVRRPGTVGGYWLRWGCAQADGGSPNL